MSVRRLAEASVQPAEFAFTPAMAKEAEKWIGKYPEGREQSAVIPLLMLAQEQDGWVTQAAIEHVAQRLDMAKIRVLEVATFYTQFMLAPVGTKAHVQVCGTTPCMLRGAEDLKRVCQSKIHHDPLTPNADGTLSWEEVECLGACVNAPMVQINDYYYEDLTPETLDEFLSKLAGGVAVEPGNFVDRLNSAPEGGATTLKEGGLYDGSRNGVAGLPNLPEATNGDKPEAEAKGEPARSKPTNVDREEVSKAAVEKADEEGELEGERPEAAEMKAEEADDLKKIKGIGPKIENQLHELGVFTYAQIAAWTPDNVTWVDGYLSFRGRIQREGWIEQARTLASEDKS